MKKILTIDQIEAILDSPLSAFDVEWKPFDAKGDKWCRYAPYIDARAVRRLLDAAFTRWGWSQEYREVAGGFLCTITADVIVSNQMGTERLTITKSDAANLEAIEPLKSGASNSLKRAAVGFGIGASLYEFPRISIEMKDRQGQAVDSKALYKVLDWAMPHLDSLVTAFGLGWRGGDQVWLKSGQNPPWHNYKDTRPVERSVEPADPSPPSAANQPTEQRDGETEHFSAPKAMTKKEVAEAMREQQEVEALILSAVSTADFQAIASRIMGEGGAKLDVETKRKLLGGSIVIAKKWGVSWNRDGYCFYFGPTDVLKADEQGVVDAWLDSIAAMKTAEEAQALYDEYRDTDLLMRLLTQPLIDVCADLKIHVQIDKKTGLIEFLPF